MPPGSYLDRLPLEIISLISDALDNDLVGHIVFSQLRPYIDEYCYTRKGEEFWQKILRASGISLVESEVDDYHDEVWWRRLAFECVEHAEACHHSQCGIARLRGNEEQMEISDEAGLDLMRTVRAGSHSNSDIESDDYRCWDLPEYVEASTAWSAITFKRSSREWWRLITEFETWREAAFIRADLPAGDRTLAYGDRLANHPIIWRSFATFPPVDTFAVVGNMPVEARNPMGAVVADFIEEMMQIDHNRYPVQRDVLTTLFNGVERQPNETPLSDPVVPRTWSFEDGFKAFQRFRDWFAIVRWTGLDVVPDEEYVSFSWKFETQVLPADYREFAALIEYPEQPSDQP